MLVLLLMSFRLSNLNFVFNSALRFKLSLLLFVFRSVFELLFRVLCFSKSDNNCRLVVMLSFVFVVYINDLFFVFINGVELDFLSLSCCCFVFSFSVCILFLIQYFSSKPHLHPYKCKGLI